MAVNWMLFQTPLLFAAEVLLVDFLLYLVVLKLKSDRRFWLIWHSLGWTALGLLLSGVFGLFNVGNLAVMGLGIVLVARLMNSAEGSFRKWMHFALIGSLLGTIVVFNQAVPNLEKLLAFQGNVEQIEDLSQLNAPVTQATVLHNARVETEHLGTLTHETQTIFVVPLVTNDWDPSIPVTAWLDVSPVNWIPGRTIQNPKPQAIDWNGRLYPITMPAAPTAELYSGAVMNALSVHGLKGDRAAMVYQMVPADKDLVRDIHYFIGLARFFLWLRFVGAVVLLVLSQRPAER